MTAKGKGRKTIQERTPKFSPFAGEVARGLNEAIDFVRGRGPARVTEVEIPDEAPAYGARDVARIRKRLGLSQVRFARLMNVSPQSVESWESGKKSPGPTSRRLLQMTSDPETLRIMAELSGYALVKGGKQLSRK